ncbi:MotA/TolQ/ExbB proton channel family protein [Tautonia sociabilis]|uniref:MotA/TolQ/ExbB proton channel family protein n=1 Tax=Tautonia sociabilis TaxID=2080755 RepID=A0A432MK25_9BACT|nr:MotA/TolQ/ExbB proton channel family protein [Tautonia sociabilis]RUL87610.1 MotA/TolQ/ExbB proton channel family protein [Tautonia sociabilis]
MPIPIPGPNPIPKGRLLARFLMAAFLAAPVVALGLGILDPAPALAQDGEAAPPPPEPEDAPAPEAVPAPEPEPTAEPAPAGTTSSGPTRSKSGLQWFIESSGIIGGLIIILSITMVAMIIRLFLEFRLKEAVPPNLVDLLDNAIREKKFQEAYDACRDDTSFLARLVRTGVANMPNGRAEAKEAMNATAEEIVVDMESKNSYLGTIGTIAPMLGLLGTVLGMILAFQDLATVEGVQVDPTKLAGNISLALVTTFEGLIVSVPAIFFFAFFRNRIIFIATETTKIADRTISAFWQAAKQQQGVTRTAT